MQEALMKLPHHDDIPVATINFYRAVLEVLNEAKMPYLVGGAYAFNHFTGINRHTKDFDIFIDRADYGRISDALADAGYTAELTYPHWLAKTYRDGDFVDLIFSSGNGIAEVDQAWFEHAVPAEIFGVATHVCPVEEIIWSKAFVMERERYDGADIAHLLLARSEQMDWTRLLQRFTPHWRLLLSHLTLFGLIYPAHRDLIPTWVMDDLLRRLEQELRSSPPQKKLCGGTLLSREQYLSDIVERDYQDARIRPHGNMSAHEVAKWTAAIPVR